jgi:hypothetical protein
LSRIQIPDQLGQLRVIDREERVGRPRKSVSRILPKLGSKMKMSESNWLREYTRPSFVSGGAVTSGTSRYPVSSWPII